MAGANAAKTAVSPAVIVIAIIVLLVILGFVGWKSVGGGASGERVPVDMNKVKENIKQNGFGHN